MSSVGRHLILSLNPNLFPRSDVQLHFLILRLILLFQHQIYTKSFISDETYSTVLMLIMICHLNGIEFTKNHYHSITIIYGCPKLLKLYIKCLKDQNSLQSLFLTFVTTRPSYLIVYQCFIKRILRFYLKVVLKS